MPVKNKKQYREKTEDKVIALAQELVRIPSVTALDPKDKPASAKSLDVVAARAEQTGAKIHRSEYSGGHKKWSYPVENLYMEWTLGQGKPDKHICYIGHLDVVPPGDASKWSRDPFSGEIKDGYLYGRGVTDMKGSVAAFQTAVEDMVAHNHKGESVKVSMLITTDEEWAAINGTKKVLHWMKENGIEPDAFIVGEPSSQDTLGSHIKVGRRGSLVGTFNVSGVQGHAAYKDLFDNPNRALALAISILSSKEWQDGKKHFPATNFEPVALQSGNFNSSAVIPGKAEALWNIRFTPDHTPETLEQWVKDSLANPPDWAKNHPDAKKLGQVGVTANKDTASRPYYSEPRNLATAASQAIFSTLGKAPIYDASGGTTDGRFVSEAFPNAEIIELGLPERGGITCRHKIPPADYLDKGGMHQVDERASLQDLRDLKRIFERTIQRYAAIESRSAKKLNKRYGNNGSHHP